MRGLKFQNFYKAKKERIDTLFKKACNLSRIFLHNPPKKGRVALLIEYDKEWQIFLSEENKSWPINFKRMPRANIKYVKDIRSEKEAKEDQDMETGSTPARKAEGTPAKEDDSSSSSDCEFGVPFPEKIPPLKPITSPSDVPGSNCQSSPVMGTTMVPSIEHQTVYPSPEVPQKTTNCISESHRPRGITTSSLRSRAEKSPIGLASVRRRRVAVTDNVG